MSTTGIFQVNVGLDTSAQASYAANCFILGQCKRSAVYSDDMQVTTNASRASFTVQPDASYLEANLAHLHSLPAVLAHYGLAGDYSCWEEQLMVYPRGGGIRIHVDQEAHGRIVAPRRQITTLLYINGAESFLGGEIEFPNQGTKITPVAGLLVAFPGTAEYPHLVHPITNGLRVVFSKSWAMR